MAELPELHKITAAQTLRMLTMHEAQLRELTERVRLQDELLEATVNALATICEQVARGCTGGRRQAARSGVRSEEADRPSATTVIGEHQARHDL
jgi:hypothetical protein